MGKFDTLKSYFSPRGKGGADKKSINLYLDEIHGPTAKISVIAPIKCGLDGLKV